MQTHMGGRAHSMGLNPEDGDDIQGANQANPLVVRIVADWGGGVVSVFLQAEGDVDGRSNWRAAGDSDLE